MRVLKSFILRFCVVNFENILLSLKNLATRRTQKAKLSFFKKNYHTPFKFYLTFILFTVPRQSKFKAKT
jgi:hypothetical protein